MPGGRMQVAAAKQDRFVVRPSHIAGIGVYAVEDIPAKEVLMEYSGAALCKGRKNNPLPLQLPRAFYGPPSICARVYERNTWRLQAC